MWPKTYQKSTSSSKVFGLEQLTLVSVLLFWTESVAVVVTVEADMASLAWILVMASYKSGTIFQMWHKIDKKTMPT